MPQHGQLLINADTCPLAKRREKETFLLKMFGWFENALKIEGFCLPVPFACYAKSCLKVGEILQQSLLPPSFL